MHPFLHLVGIDHSVEIFGIDLVGLDAKNAHKALITLVFFALIFTVGWFLRFVIARVPKRWNPVPSFWMRQAVNMLVAFLVLVGFLSIWFDNPARLATGIGLASAGLAFALQKFVTSIAGYYVILSTNNFTVGDRILMGGVRGDVIALNFIQTTIMEMGEPAGLGGDPGMWVQSRQFTGRIVSISNSMIFDSPVYNYTRDFQFIWEEIHVQIAYTADHAKVESILLEIVKKYTVRIEDIAEPELEAMYQRFSINPADLNPRVFFRMTDNWVEQTVRFIARDHGIRELKDKIYREIITALALNKIGIASGTYDIVGLPPIKVQMMNQPPEGSRPDLSAGTRPAA